MSATVTADGKSFDGTKYDLVGSVKKVKCREIARPPVVGEYPVFVEQFGGYRMFTYSRKIKEIEE